MARLTEPVKLCEWMESASTNSICNSERRTWFWLRGGKWAISNDSDGFNYAFKRRRRFVHIKLFRGRIEVVKGGSHYFLPNYSPSRFDFEWVISIPKKLKLFRMTFYSYTPSKYKCSKTTFYYLSSHPLGSIVIKAIVTFSCRSLARHKTDFLANKY